MGVRTRRLPGRHTDTAATQAGPPTVRTAAPTEDIPVTAPTTGPQIRPVTDATLDDWFYCHERAMGKAQTAYDKAVLVEEQVRQEVTRGDGLRDQVAELRRQAADLDRQADEAFEAANTLGTALQKLRTEQKGHQDNAAGHDASINLHLPPGRQHPRDRRTQASAQPPAQPQAPPTALDLPLAQVEQPGPAPVGSADTRGFVAVSSGAPIGAAT